VRTSEAHKGEDMHCSASASQRAQHPCLWLTRVRPCSGRRLLAGPCLYARQRRKGGLQTAYRGHNRALQTALPPGSLKRTALRDLQGTHSYRVHFEYEGNPMSPWCVLEGSLSSADTAQNERVLAGRALTRDTCSETAPGTTFPSVPPAELCTLCARCVARARTGRFAIGCGS
jgi:hypothetical protein